MVCLASVRRAAIVLRMPSSLTSVNSRPSYMRAIASAEGAAGAGAAAGAEAAAGAAAGAEAGAEAEAPSTSALTMRPCGPEPVKVVRSTPLSAAMRRASGEAKTRLPSPVAGAAGAGASVLGASAAPASDAAAAGAAAGADPMSSAVSPSARRTAMAVLTLTPSEPSGIRILPITPSSTASNSIVALSVSISARRSPELTVSPSLTSHFASVPSSIVGDRAGIRISVGMR